MKSQGRLLAIALLLGAMISTTWVAAGPGGQHGGGLNSLRRAIAQANATALTTDQETQITALVTAYRNALPDDDDDAALEAARDAFDAAVLAGNAAGAQAQATIIANLNAANTAARLNAEATFEIAVLALLRTGGQLTPLVTQFGNDRVLSLIDGLIGGSGGGRH